ncbi:MAG: Dyp-type peroxidase [Actinomycetia bacterium]|nr:Dyp-type peroxidase [Actinomycetes bacterium]
MTSPQPGIFAEGTSTHRVQKYDIASSADAEHIRAALSGLAATIESQSDRGAEIVVGFGADLAQRLTVETPADFRSFETIGQGVRSAPATQHDLIIWVHGNGPGDVFDASLAARRTLADIGEIVSDVSAFVYHDSRDLTGFIDGTENPAAEEGCEIAVVDEGLPGAGGSILLVQRWVHDLDTFHALDVPDQERVIGRTKPDSVELDEAVLPDDAHITRVVMEDDDGEEIEIYRRSVPFGNSTEAGLMFLGFTDELAKIDNMLREMYGVSDGVHDRVIDFSQARSSGYYFAPSKETLHRLNK